MKRFRIAGAAVRRTILLTAFQLLYGPAARLHEPIGRALFGRAWHARRLTLVTGRARSDHRVLDVGAGDGRLLQHLVRHRWTAVGVEPSRAMLRLARSRDVPIVQARASQLPFVNGIFDAIVSTYPGPWIMDQHVWDEFSRVTKEGATVSILVGGTYERGRHAGVRSVLARVMYGSSDPGTVLQSALGHLTIHGDFVVSRDAWGEVLRWEGRRVPYDPVPLRLVGSSSS